MPRNRNNRFLHYRLAEHYGSRRGFALTYWHRFLYLLGRYREYRDIDWRSVERLVFVCKGNICRSAYAEAVARSLGLASISCGIDTVDGGPANEEAIRTAALKGIDLRAHQTTPLQSLNFEKGDLLIAMEPWQVEHLQQALGAGLCYTLLGLWGGRAVRPHIQDPFGASSVYFDNCFNYIEKSVYEVAKKIS